MYRLGRAQQLKRRFKYFSILSYVVVLGGTWEYSVVTSTFGLANGGTAGTIWISVIVCIGMFLAMLSLAEVASMAPTSDGQYHWVSEISPRRYQRPLSYIAGWMALLAWQVAVPANAYICAQQLLALACVCDPSYVIEGWHAALLTIAISIAIIAMSIFVMQTLSFTQGLAVLVQCLGFIAFLAILWTLGPKASASDTFLQFQDDNNWGSKGLATLVGIIGPVATFIGGDAVVHLAEELQDASYVLPRAMVSGAAINYTVGLVALISFLFNVGSIDDSLYIYGGQPWVAVIYRITGSRAATIVMLLLMASNFFFLSTNCVITSSKQLWAFARDKGVPFHTFLAKVGPDGIPRNAVTVTLLFSVVLSLVLIGSSTVFNILFSFGCAGMQTTYLLCIACIIGRRFSSEPFPDTKFSLGRSGLVINILAVAYLTVALIFGFFPPMPNPDPAAMNWACLMFASICIGVTAWYFIRARSEYDGPVEYVRKSL